MTQRRPDEHPADWLARSIEALDLTAHQVAVEARVSPSTLYRWRKTGTSPYWHSWERVERVISGHWAKRDADDREAG